MNKGKFLLTSYFVNASETSKHFVEKLVEQSFAQLGEQTSLALGSQWMILSQLLNSSNKFCYLQDRNYRALIIEFINQEAVQKFRTSYFNHAKISHEYVASLKQVGAYEFIEIVKIVNKLKLIEKHYRQKMELNTFSESHIDEKIRFLLSLCLSKKRSENNNFAKFKVIADFQDRIELIKELGKLLRQSWKNEKRNIKSTANNRQVAPAEGGEANSQTEIIELVPYSDEEFFNFF